MNFYFSKKLFRYKKNPIGFLSLCLLFFAGAVFADSSKCVNPVTIPVGENVTMKFCEISEARSVVIGDENGEDDEKPARARYFHFKFHLGQFEVTQQQYKTVTGKAPWKGKPFAQEGDNNPASYITHVDAEEFLKALNGLEKGASYRLPSEAEFEYAARGGTTTNYYWGDIMNPDFAYFSGNSEASGHFAQPVESCPSPARNQKTPGYCANNFGLFHMLGNVWEWTTDEYVPNYLRAPLNGHARQWVNDIVKPPRVIRGGGWDSNAQSLRSSNRGNVHGAFANVGFRVLRLSR